MTKYREKKFDINNPEMDKFRFSVEWCMNGIRVHVYLLKDEWKNTGDYGGGILVFYYSGGKEIRRKSFGGIQGMYYESRNFCDNYVPNDDSDRRVVSLEAARNKKTYTEKLKEKKAKRKK